MDIYYKPNKLYVVPDAFLRLASIKLVSEIDEGILDVLYNALIQVLDKPIPVYYITLVEIIDNFKVRLRTLYINNPR